MKTAELASAFDVSFQIQERDGGLTQLTRCRELLHEIVHSDDVRRVDLDALYRELGGLGEQLTSLERASGFRLRDGAPESTRHAPSESATWRILEPSLLPPTAAVDLPSDTRTALLALLDESPVPLLLVRLSDRRVCYANRRAGDLFEVPSARLIERPLD